MNLIRVSLNWNKTHCFDISLLGSVKASAYHSTPVVGSPLLYLTLSRTLCNIINNNKLILPFDLCAHITGDSFPNGKHSLLNTHRGNNISMLNIIRAC